MISTWTAFCSRPDTLRGHYDEEIDVEADTLNHAKKKAEERIRIDYEDNLKIRRLVRRPPGFWF